MNHKVDQFRSGLLGVLIKRYLSFGENNTRWGRRPALPSLFLVILILLMVSCSSGNQYNFYIAPGGNDAGSGTKDHPFATFERAQKAVRNVLKNEKSRKGITVWVHGGTYRFTKTFVLDSLDSGTKQAPVVYRSVPGEKVYLVGGREISPSAFKPVHDPNILHLLHSGVRDHAYAHVVQADLRSLGITDYGELKQHGHSLPVVPAPIELFFNDNPMQLARYPNLGEIAMGKVIDPGSIPRVGDYSGRGGTFKYTDPRESRWAGLKDVWLQGTFKWGYADDMIRVASIDTVKHEIKLASPHLYGLGSGQPYQQYVALNILDELDEPGEYYLNRDTGILYFWPPQKLQGSQIVVSMLDKPFISLINASHVVIRGFTIEDGRGLGVYIEGGGYNLIAGCVIRNMGTAGILMGQGSEAVPGHSGLDGKNYKGVAVSGKIGDLITHLYNDKAWNRHAGTHQRVVSCDIYNTGSGGVFLGGGDKVTLTHGHSSVVNCRIHDYNRRNKFLYAAIDVDGVGNYVAHNEIYNSGYQGIYVNGNDHIFEYNIIHDVAMNSDDVSPWYIGRDPSDRGNIVRYNFFHHIGRRDRMVMGVYLDDGACGTTIFGNVFYKVGTYGTVYSNSGSDNIVKNNIFISSYGPAVHLKSMWYDFGKSEVQWAFGPHGIYRKRLTESVDIHKPPYSTRYPKLQHFLDLLPDGKTYSGMRPSGNVMEWNVVYNCPQALRLTAPYARFDSLNNYITNENPGFVDMEHLNFQLKDNSIVYKKLKGFKKIPFDKMGVKPDKYRTQ